MMKLKLIMKKVIILFLTNFKLLENKIKSHLEINDYVNNLNDINLSLNKNNLKK